MKMKSYPDVAKLLDTLFQLRCTHLTTANINGMATNSNGLTSKSYVEGGCVDSDLHLE